MLKKSLYLSMAVAIMSVTASAQPGQRGEGNCQAQEQGYGQGKGRGQGHGYGQGRQGQGYGRGHQGQTQGQNNTANQNSTTVTTELTAETKVNLVYMLEEEKVARDVYLRLYQKWGSRVFNNISKAEQRHMNAILRLVNKYNLEVPSTLESVGEFQNEKLQTMFNTLVEKGEASQKEAFEVGIEVEETDIADLKEQLASSSTPSSVKNIYTNLLNGSYKHLNAFTRQLSR